MKKLTLYSWIILILVGISFVSGIIFSIINFFKSSFNLSGLMIFYGFLDGIYLIITGIFFIKLYNVRLSLFRWVNIFFGYLIFSITYEFLGVIIYVLFKEMSLSNLIETGSYSLYFIMSKIGIYLIIWITFYKHLRKAQRERLMEFS